MKGKHMPRFGFEKLIKINLIRPVLIYTLTPFLERRKALREKSILPKNIANGRNLG